MGMMLTRGNFTDPTTGLPVVSGFIMCALTGDIMVTLSTGAAPGSYNTKPGTDIFVPASLGENAPGLPRAHTATPSVGYLIANGKIVVPS